MRSCKQLKGDTCICLGCYFGQTFIQIEFVHLRFGYSVCKLLTLSMLLLKLNCRLHGVALIWGCGTGATFDGVEGRAPHMGIGGKALSLILFPIFPIFSDFHF